MTLCIIYYYIEINHTILIGIEIDDG